MKIHLDLTDKRLEMIYGELLKTKHVVSVFDGFHNVRKNELCVFSPAKTFTAEDIISIPADIKIIAGNINNEGLSLLQDKRVSYVNLLNNERFAMNNAILTAEGVLALILQIGKKSMFEHKILIIGVGRIGKALAILFGKLGLNYTLGSFSQKNYDYGYLYGDQIMPNGTFMQNLNKFDLIINTIPKQFFTIKDISLIRAGTIFLDTASIACLDDKNVQNFTYKTAPKLPQIFTLKTASSLLLNEILEVLDD